MEGTQEQATHISPDEAAKRLGLSRDAIDEMIARGELPSTRFSARRVRIPVRELEQYLASRTVVPAAPDDEVPDAAQRAAATRAALIRRRARLRWDGLPDPTPKIEFPAGVSVGSDGTLRGM